MQALYVHFSYPTTTTKLTDMQNKLNLKKNENLSTELYTLDMPFKNCDAVLKNFEAIECVLTEEIEAQESKDVAQAIGTFYKLIFD